MRGRKGPRRFPRRFFAALDRARGAFGPRSFRVARFLITSRAPTLIDLLDEVAEAWPGLSFEDFRGGYILSDIWSASPIKSGS
jgi:hypothetical protein